MYGDRIVVHVDGEEERVALEHDNEWSVYMSLQVGLGCGRVVPLGMMDDEGLSLSPGLAQPERRQHPHAQAAQRVPAADARDAAPHDAHHTDDPRHHNGEDLEEAQRHLSEATR